MAEQGSAAHEAAQRPTGQQWRWSVLAGMASFLDAGSIVALGVSISIWQQAFGFGETTVGLIAALGPNAIGCAIGAVIGGRLGDLLGRKRIYQYDLIVYAIGILIIATAQGPAMLMIGTVIVGLAVGADVPTSLALVGEFAPDKARGRLLGFSQVAWNCGPVVVLLVALVTTPLGLLGTRIVFATLFAAAAVTYLLRRGMVESARWQQARSGGGTGGETRRTGDLSRVRQLFSGPHLMALAWTAGLYVFWNLAAGTNGIFTPYIITTLGAASQAASVALQCAGFVIGILATVLVFMPLSDRGFVTRRTMWGIGSLMQIAAFAAYLVFPFAVPVIIANIVLFGVGGALAGEAVYKVFSQELFPTMLRGTAQGLTFGLARLLLGVWSFVVPLLTDAGIRPVAALLAVFLLISGVIGFVGMPDTVGKSLEQIEAERSAGPKTSLR